MAKFEGSKKDVREDKTLAKRNKMAMKDWESSKMEEEHDEKKGMKKGGVTSADAKKYGRNLARVKNQKSR